MKTVKYTKNKPIKIRARKIMTVALLALLPLFFACNPGVDENSQILPPDPDPKEENEKKEIPDANPIELRLTEKTETDNDFALDLFKTTYKFEDKDNIFISPLSVSMALSMTINGAKGVTLEEMKKALRVQGYSVEDINEYNKTLKKALMEVDETTNFTIANSIWYRNNITVFDNFISVNKNNYDAEIKPIDFTLPNAVTQINNWCALHTNDKIKVIINAIPDNALMYLINAIYFKGAWATVFKKEDTDKENFFSEENEITGEVDMMRQIGGFEYFADDYCEYLRLPYGNKAFSMIVMLPKKDKTVNDVISDLNSKQWNNAMEMISMRMVNLSFPRFKVECEYNLEGSILPEMGMITPFTGSADFTGIMNNSSQISRVIHKTFVEVNEEGTEAAAVTAIEMVTSAGDYNEEPQIINYIVNKPFVFAIRENSTGAILFIGKMGKIEK